MSKYLVETFYTCTFKITHKLDELNEKKLSELQHRKDGKIEITDRDITTNLPFVEGVSLAFDHHYSETLRLDAKKIQPYMGMAEIAEQRNDPATAIRYLRDAQQRNEHAMAEPIIARKLAWLLAASPQEALRNGSEALALANAWWSLPRHYREPIRSWIIMASIMDHLPDESKVLPPAARGLERRRQPRTTAPLADH